MATVASIDQQWSDLGLKELQLFRGELGLGFLASRRLVACPDQPQQQQSKGPCNLANACKIANACQAGCSLPVATKNDPKPRLHASRLHLAAALQHPRGERNGLANGVAEWAKPSLDATHGRLPSYDCISQTRAEIR
jgi:hypothetical protein